MKNVLFEQKRDKIMKQIGPCKKNKTEIMQHVLKMQ
jgi:hypothetical protein